MDIVTLPILACLCLAAFLAGFVDAVAGGGGLVQLPALLMLVPTAPIPMLFGTNKVSSICGTSVALFRYTRSVQIPWRQVLPGALLAFVASILGARALTIFPPHHLRPVIAILFALVAVQTIRHHDMGTRENRSDLRANARLWLLVAFAAIGFYDGFFGPGTGQFLILAMVTLTGMTFLEATASAKVINFSTNLAAVIYFAHRGDVLWTLAIPMAMSNVLGGWMGARAAILKGNRFIRRVFLGMILALVLKLLWETFQ
jgi:uncharacterized membrane protein YfcA